MDIIDISNTEIEIDISTIEFYNLEKKVESVENDEPEPPPVKMFPKINFHMGLKNFPYRPYIIEFHELNLAQGYVIFEGRVSFFTPAEIESDYSCRNMEFDRRLPKQAILSYKETKESQCLYYFINIYDKEIIKDTSRSWYDEEEGYNICLFPQYILKLHFTLLEQLSDVEHFRIKEKKLKELTDAAYLADQKSASKSNALSSAVVPTPDLL